MKKWTLAVLLAMLVAAVPAVAQSTNVVTPEFEDHDITGAVVDFSTEQTTLGANSVKMYIPEGGIPDVYNLGLNAEVRLATGMSRSRGLVMYDGVSFKAKPGDGIGGHALYVSLILYDATNRVWVSMLNYGPSWSEPDGAGWCTVNVPVGAEWDAWTFGGDAWPVGIDPGYISLAGWDAFIASEGIDARVRKVNIQFGYDANPSAGTVYVDGLSFADRTLDFEP